MEQEKRYFLFFIPLYVGSGFRDEKCSDLGSRMEKCSDPGSGMKHPGDPQHWFCYIQIFLYDMTRVKI
jgi:hypothetical protein